MKHILFISPTAGYAGIDVCLETLVMGLDRTKYEPVVVFAQNALLKPKFEAIGVRCYELPLNWWFPVGFSSSDLLYVLPTLRDKVDPLVQIIKDNRIDIVFSNTSVGLDGAVAAGICDVPHLFFLHAQFAHNIYVDMQEETRAFLYALMGKLSHKLVCCSQLLHNVISKYADNSMCIYNGVDIERFQFRLRQTEAKAKILKMVCVGHYNANKQQDFVLRALKILKDKRPDLLERVCYTMVGPGEPAYQQKLRTMIQEYGIGKSVSMEDFRDDIDSYLDQFDIYINSSITENLPVSVLEAMACGLPTLGTVNDGTMQLIDDGNTGFLCCTEEDLVQRIIELLEGRHDIATLSRNARARVENLFSTTQYITNFQKTFEDILAMPRKGKQFASFVNGFYESVVGTSLTKYPSKRILVVYPPAAMPTYILGVVKPFEILEKLGLVSYRGVAPHEVDFTTLNQYDIVLCVRFYDTFAHDLLQHTKQAGKAFIWLIDDNYDGLHIEDGKAIHETKANSPYEQMYRDSSHVLVYSGQMYHFGRRFTNNITRMPTQQISNEDLTRNVVRQDNVIVFGFMGTLLRDGDFECVVPAILRVLKRYQMRVRIEFIGYCPDVLRGYPQVKTFDFESNYDEFRMFFAQRAWNFALAPLADTLFNRSKTNNKYREYSSFHIPGIYSDVEAYACVQDGENGILVENTVDDWYKAICKMIDSKALRTHIADTALEDIKQNYSMEAYAKALMRVLCSGHASSPVAPVNTCLTLDPPTATPKETLVHYPKTYDPNNICFSGYIRKRRRYAVFCEQTSLQMLGVLFGTEADSIGDVTVRLYSGKHLLRAVTKEIRTLSFVRWNYFEFERIYGMAGKTLTIELDVQCSAGAIGTYEDPSKRTFWYKVMNKLGLPLPGMDTLMVDFVQ